MVGRPTSSAAVPLAGFSTMRGAWFFERTVGPGGPARRASALPDRFAAAIEELEQRFSMLFGRAVPLLGGKAGPGLPALAVARADGDELHQVQGNLIFAAPRLRLGRFSGIAIGGF